MESDGVMDGQHSTFENVFEMCQKVETAEVEERDERGELSIRRRAARRSGGQSWRERNARSLGVVSIFKLIPTRRAGGRGRRRYILRSTASLPLVARTNASRQTTHQEYGRRLALAGMPRFTMLFISF